MSCQLPEVGILDYEFIFFFKGWNTHILIFFILGNVAQIYLSQSSHIDFTLNPVMCSIAKTLPWVLKKISFGTHNPHLSKYKPEKSSILAEAICIFQGPSIGFGPWKSYFKQQPSFKLQSCTSKHSSRSGKYCRKQDRLDEVPFAGSGHNNSFYIFHYLRKPITMMINNSNVFIFSKGWDWNYAEMHMTIHFTNIHLLHALDDFARNSSHPTTKLIEERLV